MSSRFRVIKREIIERIENGELKPGDAIASENQLAEQYEVSRMTARRALTELVDAGVLERTQGAGTFVAEQLPSGSLVEIRSIDIDIRERGHQHRADVIRQCHVEADAELARKMSVAPGTPLYCSYIVHYETDTHGATRPLQVEHRYVNPDVVPEFLQQDFTQITPSAYLSQVSPLNRAEHWVEAVMPDTDIAAQLQLPAQTPCLKLTRTTYSHWRNGVRGEQQTVTHAILYHPGDRYRLGGQLTTGE